MHVFFYDEYHLVLEVYVFDVAAQEDVCRAYDAARYESAALVEMACDHPELVAAPQRVCDAIGFLRALLVETRV